MIKILVDHNLEGQALTVWGALVAEGWLELFSAELVRFADVGLPIDSNDREVWRFAQANQMILLTNNRNMKGDDSLGQTLREENTLTSLPVITIGNPNRLSEREYRADSGAAGLVVARRRGQRAQRRRVAHHYPSHLTAAERRRGYRHAWHPRVWPKRLAPGRTQPVLPGDCRPGVLLSFRQLQPSQ